jgi:thiol-disulfide isomerase/thioredoxin
MQELEKRTVAITNLQAKFIQSVKESRTPKTADSSEVLKPLDSAAVPFNVVNDLMDLPAAQHEFCTHSDPLIRFPANLRLAAQGDSDAAARLLSILSDDMLTNFDARLIKTGCLEIGFDLTLSSPDEIVKQLSAIANANRVRFNEGDTIEDFEAKDINGTTFKLSDYRGKYVLIHFWATNCGPCMTQMPAFKKKITELADFPLEVVLVSLDYDEASFENVKDQLGIACRHMYDGRSISGPIAQHFRIDRMPIDVVIDPSGKFLSYTVDTLIEKAAPGKPAEPSNAR